MKYKVEAVEDLEGEYGGLGLNVKAGDKIDLSIGDYETLQRSPFKDNFKMIDNQKAEFLKLSKEDLVKKAENLQGFKSSMNKEDLVALILGGE